MDDSRKGKPITVEGWGDVDPGELRGKPAADLERLKSLLEVKLAIISSQIQSAEEKRAATGESPQDLEWRLRAGRARALFSSLQYQVAAALKYREKMERIEHERTGRVLWYRTFLKAAREHLPPEQFNRFAATADRVTGMDTTSSRAEMTDVP